MHCVVRYNLHIIKSGDPVGLWFWMRVIKERANGEDNEILDEQKVSSRVIFRDPQVNLKGGSQCAPLLYSRK